MVLSTRNTLLQLIILVFLGWTSSAKKFPPYLTLCRASDPQIEQCFLRAVEELRPHLRDGIPELQLPPMNPLVIPEAGINSGQFKASFKDIQVYFGDEFVIDKLNVDLPNNHLELLIRFPRLRIKSTYHINGKLLLFQLDGHGPADGNFTDVSGTANIKTNRVSRKGKQYLNVNNEHKIHLKIGKPHFHFENLFGDNQELNDSTNQAINDNIVDIIEELRPVVEKIVADFIFGSVKRILDRFSFDELFPK